MAVPSPSFTYQNGIWGFEGAGLGRMRSAIPARATLGLDAIEIFRPQVEGKFTSTSFYANYTPTFDKVDY